MSQTFPTEVKDNVSQQDELSYNSGTAINPTTSELYYTTETINPALLNLPHPVDSQIENNATFGFATLGEPCPVGECNGIIQLRVCRGTMYPEYKGLLYMACNGHLMCRSIHFISWVDAPRQNVDEAVKDLNLANFTMQQLLMRPLTPTELPPQSALESNPQPSPS